jgi:hypothetical protein
VYRKTKVLTDCSIDGLILIGNGACVVCRTSAICSSHPQELIVMFQAAGLVISRPHGGGASKEWRSLLTRWYANVLYVDCCAALSLVSLSYSQTAQCQQRPLFPMSYGSVYSPSLPRRTCRRFGWMVAGSVRHGNETLSRHLCGCISWIDGSSTWTSIVARTILRVSDTVSWPQT